MSRSFGHIDTKVVSRSFVALRMCVCVCVCVLQLIFLKLEFTFACVALFNINKTC